MAAVGLRQGFSVFVAGRRQVPKVRSARADSKIVKDYSVDGKSIYSESFIEDNEAKVKALQEKYEFKYEIIEK